MAYDILPNVKSYIGIARTALPGSYLAPTLETIDLPTFLDNEDSSTDLNTCILCGPASLSNPDAILWDDDDELLWDSSDEVITEE